MIRIFLFSCFLIAFLNACSFFQDAKNHAEKAREQVITSLENARGVVQEIQEKALNTKEDIEQKFWGQSVSNNVKIVGNKGQLMAIPQFPRTRGFV